MKTYNKYELDSFSYSLTFDDISLVPKEVSEIKSRTNIDLSSDFLGKHLAFPVISSPMDMISGIEMCNKLKELGCMGILHRFGKDVLQYRNQVDCFSIGLNETDFTINENQILCIDIANSNNRYVFENVNRIKEKYPNIKIIVGNVCNGSTYYDLLEHNIDAIRVGIGNGSICTTSVQTGIGIGQVSAIVDVVLAREKSKKGYNKKEIKIIADGGIKTAGDICKAISLGADAVLVGRMIAGSKETPGEIFKDNYGNLCKKYRGSSSYAVKMNGTFIEGDETIVPYKGSVEDIITSIKDGLRSCMSYLNCKTLQELKEIEDFAVLSHNSFIERLAKK